MRYAARPAAAAAHRFDALLGTPLVDVALAAVMAIERRAMPAAARRVELPEVQVDVGCSPR